MGLTSIAPNDCRGTVTERFAF